MVSPAEPARWPECESFELMDWVSGCQCQRVSRGLSFIPEVNFQHNGHQRARGITAVTIPVQGLGRNQAPLTRLPFPGHTTGPTTTCNSSSRISAILLWSLPRSKGVNLGKRILMKGGWYWKESLECPVYSQSSLDTCLWKVSHFQVPSLCSWGQLHHHWPFVLSP